MSLHYLVKHKFSKIAIITINMVSWSHDISCLKLQGYFVLILKKLNVVWPSHFHSKQDNSYTPF